MQPCEFCSTLTVERLTNLAEKELGSPWAFPRQYYFNHQTSLAALRESGQNGCKLCHAFYGDLLRIDPRVWEGDQRGYAVEEAEEEGKNTDIKIALRSGHISVGLRERSEQGMTVMLDIIMVQVGTAYKGDECYELAITPLEYSLYTSLPESLLIEPHCIGRFLTDPDLSSDVNFGIARSWLRDCENHPDCPGPRGRRLPTRVLDIGLDHNFKALKLLVTNGMMDRYTALSHCWGGTIRSILTLANQNERQDHIPFETLPLNFQDAITVTSRLGLRYLWIDALCIIQDSKIDWETESRRMGTLYRDSYATISAGASAGSVEGFLKNAGPLYQEAQFHELRLSDDPKNDQRVRIAPSLIWEEDESLRDVFYHAPLHGRGWSLQETVLATRTLHYGKRQIYYQCRAGFKSADGVPPGSREPEGEDFKHISTLNLRAQNPDRTGPLLNYEQIREEYYYLIMVYSQRKLTYGSDKFPAFSGLAELVAPAFLLGEYVAGIWTNDLAVGLAWYKEMRECKHVTMPYRAPSWSWAVTDDRVLFPAYTASQMSIRLSNGAFDIAFKSFERVLPSETSSVYSAIQAASLSVSVCAKKLIRSRQNIGMRAPPDSVATVYYDELEEDQPDSEIFAEVFDITEASGKSCLLSVLFGTENTQSEWDIDTSLQSPKEYIMVVLSAWCDEEPFEAQSVNSIVTGLVLERVMDAEVEAMYVRVGYVQFATWSDRSLTKYLRDWERRDIVMI